MSPLVIPSAAGTGIREQHILDGLDVADGTLFEIAETPVWTNGPLRLDWTGSVDSDGTIPVDEGHTDNATLLLPLRVIKQTTADLAWNKAGLLVSKLEATRRSRSGLTHLWTPKDATDTWEWTVRSGEILGMPMDSRGDKIGYLLRAHRFDVLLTGDPFLYRQGELVDFVAVTSSEPVFSIVLASVPGHVDAEATVTVTDAASRARRHVEGGMGEDSAAPLLIDADTMTAIAASLTTRAGSHSTQVMRATLATQTQAMCGVSGAHVGVHRPKARVWASSTDVRVRLAYRTADGDYSYTPWVAPPVEDNWCVVEFGVVTFGEVRAGSQVWDGRIEAYSATVGDTLDVDMAPVVTAERYFKISSPYRYQAGVLVARDEFTGITAGTVLNARVAPLGGTWATSGATTDFAAADFAIGAETEETMSRATVSDASRRYGILGSTNYAATEVAVRFYSTAPPPGSALPTMGVIARWVDASNHLAVVVDAAEGWSVQKVVGGTTTTLTSGSFAPVASTWYEMRVVIHASGAGYAWLLDSNGATIQSCGFSDSVLATGGALASGKPGLVDSNTSADAVTRHYDSFYAATPAAEPVVIHSGRSLKIRHDSCERESADGLTWGTLQPRGGRVYVPCAGDEGRVTRLWISAKRNDVDTMADDSIADSTTLDVSLRPRYRFPTNP